MKNPDTLQVPTVNEELTFAQTALYEPIDPSSVSAVKTAQRLWTINTVLEQGTPDVDIDDPSFQANKRLYFSAIAVKESTAMRLHQDVGLWERTPEGKRDWGNVSEHCLVETARVGVLADLLGLPETERTNLKTAAALHDYFKKDEKGIAAKSKFSWEGFEKASESSNEGLRNAGFSEPVIDLANAVGHGSLQTAERLLEQTDFTTRDLAWLAMHYVDDYTIGSEWVGTSGDPTEAFEARMLKNEQNERYNLLNEQGREFFDGRTTFETQRLVGLAVQERLAAIVSERAGREVLPNALPMLVDDIIRQQIITQTHQ